MYVRIMAEKTIQMNKKLKRKHFSLSKIKS